MPINNDYPAKQASNWFVQLSSGSAKDADYQRWQQWRQASPDNESAWQKVEQLTSQFKGFSSEKAVVGTLRRLYDKPASLGRRNILKQMAVLMAVGSSSYLVYKKQPWQELTADYSTSTGERREIALADGTRLFINTSSAANVEFDETNRVLTVLKGEVLIETGHEQGKYRPFIVKTRHGAMTALGTRFNVRDHDDFTRLDVFDGAVQVSPKHHLGVLIINAGESVKFTTTDLTEKAAADDGLASWAQGFIVVDQMTLGEFVTELSRYRSGLLQCDPRIAHHKVSGSFPTNTDESLAILSRKFPIQIQSFTRYWTKLIPA